MKHTAKLVVRSYELDSYNHVNNATYLNCLECGRMEFLRAIGFGYNALIDAGYYLHVTHVNIHYRAPARLFDELSIEVQPVKLGKVSGAFRQVIRNQRGVACAEAKVSQCCVNKSGKPAKIPDEFMADGLKPVAGEA